MEIIGKHFSQTYEDSESTSFQMSGDHSRVSPKRGTLGNILGTLLNPGPEEEASDMGSIMKLTADRLRDALDKKDQWNLTPNVWKGTLHFYTLPKCLSQLKINVPTDNQKQCI